MKGKRDALAECGLEDYVSMTNEIISAMKEAKACLQVVWVSHHANRCDSALEALNKAIRRLDGP